MITQKRRIAILGGGFGAITAAFELTEQPDWHDKYDITIYQIGWRLGGKAASGRNMRSGFGSRIEEHGIHVFFGFYENTFYLLQRVYEALDRPANAPLRSWSEALLPLDNVVWAERRDGQLKLITQVYARFSGKPGAAARRLREWRLPGRSSQSPSTLGLMVTGFENILRQYLSSRAPVSMISRLVHLGKVVLAALRRGRSVSQAINNDEDARQLWIELRLGWVIIKGLLVDLVPFRGFHTLNHLELEDWLTRHGAPRDILGAPLLRAGYDAAFGFTGGHLVPTENGLRPSMAAGTALNLIFRAFGYRRSALWKMQAGTGDVVFAPLYEVLRKRNVKFRFFHRITGLHLSADGKLVQRISLKQQVVLRNPESDYYPLVDVNGLPCWPSEPRWDCIRNAGPLRHELDRRGISLETVSGDVPQQQGDLELEQGAAGETGFDDVILGISIGGLGDICEELIARNPRWKRQVQEVPTTGTQAFQLWLNTSLVDLGWKQAGAPSPLVAGLVEPIDTWVDMSHLAQRENLDQTRSIAYFCGPFLDQITNSEDALRKARELARSFLADQLPQIWPRLRPDGLTDLEGRLIVPQGIGGARLDAQYWRANVVGSERYVQSAPGTIDNRLSSDASGYENLFLAGDWTNNGLNVGCAEAAVMSGMQAARGVTRRDPRRTYITVWGETRRRV